LGDYLKYYEFLVRIRDKLKSTNALERILSKIRRITGRMGYFLDSEEFRIAYIELLIFGYLKEAKLVARERGSSERKKVINFARKLLALSNNLIIFNNLKKI